MSPRKAEKRARNAKVEKNREELIPESEEDEDIPQSDDESAESDESSDSDEEEEQEGPQTHRRKLATKSSSRHRGNGKAAAPHGEEVNPRRSRRAKKGKSSYKVAVGRVSKTSKVKDLSGPGLDLCKDLFLLGKILFFIQL